jgi:HD superfamily phosphohydrolase
MAGALESLRAELDQWVGEQLEGFAFPTDCQRKIVRDAVHGYLFLLPHEVAVVDNPLIQRLRYIHQTALAYLVYPSAVHTRFEHSLGVLKTANSIAEALIVAGYKDYIDETTVRELRLAALLHDTGHVLFSHLGETILEEHFSEELEEVSHDAGDLYQNANTGEILAHLIITSAPLRAYLEQVSREYRVAFDVDRVAGFIIAKAPTPAEQYKADIINGAFDADKLDYLLRDCHFCGIKADVDVERYYQTVSIWPGSAQTPPRYLVMRQDGIPILEQILFSKMMLYTAIYHHQKIRALECMVRAMFEAIWDHQGAIANRALRFEKITDFFRMPEYRFLTAAADEPALQEMTRHLLNRQLLKRCLMISMATVSGGTAKKVFFLDSLKTKPPEARRVLRQRILEAVPADARTSVSDLWLDLPSGPDVNEDAIQCLVNTGKESPEQLSDLFPSDDWLTSYEMNKWRAHVYYTDNLASRRAVADATETVLREEFDITLSPMARTACKLPA